MVLSHHADFWQEIQTQFLQFNVWIHPQFRVDILLSDTQFRNLAGGGQFYVRIIDSVIDNSLEMINFCIARHMDVNDRPSIIFQNLRLKIYARGKHSRIGDSAYKIPHQILCGVFRNTDNCSVILYPQKDIATEPVQKRADTLIGVKLNSVSAPFELYDNVFANRQ